MKKWRLTNDLNVYIVPGTMDIYLSAVEKKSYKSEIVKRAGSVMEIKLEDNKFKLKFTNLMEPLIKSDLLPNKSSYYRVMNFDNSDIGEIITQVDSNKGDFLDLDFEAVFSDDSFCKVFFINSNMSQYRDCLLEMRRRLNWEMCKKTKKWKVGHKYEDPVRTVYYLGSVNSRRKDLNSRSMFLSDIDMSTGHLFLCTDDCIEEGTKISEIFKSKSFNHELKILSITNPMVDSGEVLVNDIGNFQDYWEDIIVNTEKDEKRVDSYGNVYYLNISNILSVLSYQTGNGSVELSESTRNILKDVLSIELKNCIYKYWNLSMSSIRVCKSFTNEVNSENLIKLLLIGIKDNNPLRVEYYKDLFDKYKIPVDTISSSVILNWNEDSVYSDFDTYVKCYNYTLARYHKDYRINQLSDEDCTPIDKVIPNNELSEVIRKIYNEAKSNFGSGVANFQYNKEKGKNYISVNITLNDIINYFKGVDKIPTSLKNTIMNFKFLNTTIKIDETRELK